MNVLLTDGSHNNTLAIIRYLGRKGHVVDILHHKRSAPAYSKYCNRLVTCPSLDNETLYVEFILSWVKEHHYDILIPVGANAVKILSQHLRELREYVHVEICDYETINMALDKRLTFQYAEKNGIRHPKTLYPQNFDEALSLSESLSFPLIIKSSNEAITKFPTIYAADRGELLRALTELQTADAENIQRCFPLIQERVVGRGYGFFAIYQHGVCKKIFMHERIREYPATGGSSTCARSFYDPKLLEAGKRILDGLHWHGQAMVEFKKDEKDGEYTLIEINPKFWGSLELCLSSGMDFPSFLCDMAAGRELDFSDLYNRNRLFQWLAAPSGELHRLFQRPSDVFRVVRDWLRFNSRSDLWISDVKPTLLQMMYFLVFVKDHFTGGKKR